MILHGVLMLLCLVAWAPWVFLLNLPIAIWHARRCVLTFMQSQLPFVI